MRPKKKTKTSPTFYLCSSFQSFSPTLISCAALEERTIQVCNGRLQKEFFFKYFFCSSPVQMTATVNLSYFFIRIQETERSCGQKSATIKQEASSIVGVTLEGYFHRCMYSETVYYLYWHCKDKDCHDSLYQTTSSLLAMSSPVSLSTSACGSKPYCRLPWKCSDKIPYSSLAQLYKYLFLS